MELRKFDDYAGSSVRAWTAPDSGSEKYLNGVKTGIVNVYEREKKFKTLMSIFNSLVLLLIVWFLIR